MAAYPVQYATVFGKVRRFFHSPPICSHHTYSYAQSHAFRHRPMTLFTHIPIGACIPSAFFTCSPGHHLLFFRTGRGCEFGLLPMTITCTVGAITVLRSRIPFAHHRS